MNIVDVILASLGSIVAYVLSKEFFLPQLNKLYKWLKTEKNETEDRTFQVGEEVHKMKMNDVEYYEKTFETLLNQIGDLENQLNSYSKELQELRTTILKLNSKLYQKSLIISDLQKKCCENAETCKSRVICKNYFCEVIENEDEDNN